jgi:hypothetical protein
MGHMVCYQVSEVRVSKEVVVRLKSCVAGGEKKRKRKKRGRRRGSDKV